VVFVAATTAICAVVFALLPTVEVTRADGSFGAVGLLLSSFGTFGAVARLASTATREMGLRLALGATRAAMFAWRLRRGLVPVGAGLAAGLLAAEVLGWALSGRLPGVRRLESAALAAASLLLTLVASIAAAIPARRVPTLDPAAALRHDG
jgi:ABC-type antimicrobial peptide transport system permease subunit